MGAMTQEEINIDLFNEVKRLRKELVAKEELINNHELTLMWLCGYVMDLHKFRDNIFTINKETKSLEEVMDFVVGKFPMLQGAANQMQFRHFGKQVKVKEINENIHFTMKRLREKTGLDN